MIERVCGRSVMERAYGFLWQHMWLLVSLFVMTLGVALCLRSDLGSSVISTIPYVMTLAGESGHAPRLSIGEYTYVMNFVLVGVQIGILRRRFEAVQLLQLVIGFVFGALLDVNVALTAAVANVTGLAGQVGLQLAGCVVLAFGIAMEIRCGSVTMPGEGVPAALSKAFAVPFAKAKICVDITLVVIAVALGYVFMGGWLWQVVGGGTLLAMVLVGALVRVFSPRMRWFDRVLGYRRAGRFVYGLARTVYLKVSGRSFS